MRLTVYQRGTDLKVRVRSTSETTARPRTTLQSAPSAQWFHMKRGLLVSLLLIAIAAQFVDGMYLSMKEGTAKCFIEEIPKETLLVANWKCEDAPKTPYNTAGLQTESLATKTFGMLVTIKDPLDQIVYTHNHLRDDKLAFTSVTGGEHLICFVTSSSTWFHAFEFVRQETTFYLPATSGSSLTPLLPTYDCPTPSNSPFVLLLIIESQLLAFTWHLTTSVTRNSPHSVWPYLPRSILSHSTSTSKLVPLVSTMMLLPSVSTWIQWL